MRMDPRKQFSKWLARYGAIFWGLYMVIVALLIYYRPEAAIACVYLALIVTANKALDTVAYTKNSTTEKIILGALDRTKMELHLKGIGTSSAGSKQENDSDDDDPEEGDNG